MSIKWIPVVNLSRRQKMDRLKKLIQQGCNCNIHDLGISLQDILQHIFLNAPPSTPQWLSKTRVEIIEESGDVIVTDLDAEAQKAPIRAIIKVLCEYLETDSTGTLITQDKFNSIEDLDTFPDVFWTEDIMLRDFTPDVSWISQESWDSMPLADRDTSRMVWYAELMVFVSMETSWSDQVSDAAVFRKVSAYFSTGKCKQLWILYAATGRTVEYTVKSVEDRSDSNSKNFIARSSTFWREIHGGTLLPGFTVGPGLLQKLLSARGKEPVTCSLCKQFFDSLRKVGEHIHSFHADDFRQQRTQNASSSRYDDLPLRLRAPT